MADGHHRMMEAQMALSYFHVTSRVLSLCAQSNHHVGERSIHLFETSLLIMWIKPQQSFLPWYNLIHKHPQKWSPRILSFSITMWGKNELCYYKEGGGKKLPRHFFQSTSCLAHTSLWGGKGAGEMWWATSSVIFVFFGFSLRLCHMGKWAGTVALCTNLHDVI